MQLLELVIVFQIYSTGFFRCHYPPSLIKLFIPAIKSKQMSAVDRIGLLDDLFAVVKSGESSTVEVSISCMCYRSYFRISMHLLFFTLKIEMLAGHTLD